MENQITLIEELAADLGVGSETCRKWRERERVAYKWRLPLMEAAAKAGKDIDIAVFDKFVRPEPAEREDA